MNKKFPPFIHSHETIVRILTYARHLGKSTMVSSLHWSPLICTFSKLTKSFKGMRVHCFFAKLGREVLCEISCPASLDVLCTPSLQFLHLLVEGKMLNKPLASFTIEECSLQDLKAISLDCVIKEETACCPISQSFGRLGA